MPKKTALQLVKAIDHRLQQNTDPTSLGKPLKGHLAGYYRLRVGNHRIVYKIFWEKIQIYVIAIGIRRDEEVYEIAESRQSQN